MTFQSNNWITLTSDFGLTDPYVGVMKAAIAQRHPHARMFDLTHDIPVYQPQVAGFWLRQCWRYFPKGSIHLAVVDPGVGSSRKMVAMLLNGQLFVAPDNGLLDPVACDESDVIWRVFDSAEALGCSTAKASLTFHGRDIFAPLVADLSMGKVSFQSLGTEYPAPCSSTAKRVMTIDHFGNLLTNIPADGMTREGTTLAIRGQLLPWVQTYASAAPGSLVALTNSWGLLEIACVQGNAARELGVEVGEPVEFAGPPPRTTGH